MLVHVLGFPVRIVPFNVVPAPRATRPPSGCQRSLFGYSSRPGRDSKTNVAVQDTYPTESSRRIPHATHVHRSSLHPATDPCRKSGSMLAGDACDRLGWSRESREEKFGRGYTTLEGRGRVSANHVSCLLWRGQQRPRYEPINKSRISRPRIGEFLVCSGLRNSCLYFAGTEL